MSDLLWLLAVPLTLGIEALLDDDRRAELAAWWRVRCLPFEDRLRRNQGLVTERDARLAEAVGRAQRDPGFYQANITNHATPGDEPRARWDTYPPPSPEPVVRPG